MKFKHILGLLCAALVSVLMTGSASAQDKTVKIGAIFPLSGNAASAGVHAKAAIETAMDIINNPHPELGNFPLAKNAGLAGLGGAKVDVVFADNQGSPATGQNQALRLITEEKVVALTGDLTVAGTAEELVGQAVEQLGGLRGVAVTTGLGMHGQRDLLSGTDDDWAATFDVIEAWLRKQNLAARIWPEED